MDDASLFCLRNGRRLFKERLNCKNEEEFALIDLRHKRRDMYTDFDWCTNLSVCVVLWTVGRWVESWTGVRYKLRPRDFNLLALSLFSFSSFSLSLLFTSSPSLSTFSPPLPPLLALALSPHLPFLPLCPCLVTGGYIEWEGVGGGHGTLATTPPPNTHTQTNRTNHPLYPPGKNKGWKWVFLWGLSIQNNLGFMIYRRKTLISFILFLSILLLTWGDKVIWEILTLSEGRPGGKS